MAHNDPMCFEKDFNPGKELFLGEGVILALLNFRKSTVYKGLHRVGI